MNFQLQTCDSFSKTLQKLETPPHQLRGSEGLNRLPSVSQLRGRVQLAKVGFAFPACRSLETSAPDGGTTLSAVVADFWTSPRIRCRLSSPELLNDATSATSGLVCVREETEKARDRERERAETKGDVFVDCSCILQLLITSEVFGEMGS